MMAAYVVPAVPLTIPPALAGPAKPPPLAPPDDNVTGIGLFASTACGTPLLSSDMPTTPATGRGGVVAAINSAWDVICFLFVVLVPSQSLGMLERPRFGQRRLRQFL